MNDRNKSGEQRPDDQPGAAADAAMREGGADPTGAAIDDVEQARRDLDEARNRLLRAQAELDNYRKRARKEP